MRFAGGTSVSHPGVDSPEARPGARTTLAAGCAVCTVVLLVLLNVYAHPVAAVDTAEADGYFLQADQLLRGQPYRDPYRPPLYALLAAGLSLLLGSSTFLAAGLLSTLATGTLVALTYVVARLFVPQKYAWLAQFLVAIDAVVAQHGLIAGTDALFAALALALVLSLVARQQRQEWTGMRGAAIMGALFGLVYLTRYTAIFLLPLLVYGLWDRDVPPLLRLRLMAAAGLSAALVMLPWLLYNLIANGSPFANENWKNFLFALYGRGDFAYLETVQPAGYTAIFTRDPLRVLRLWGINLLVLVFTIPLVHTSSPVLAIFLPAAVRSLVRAKEGRLLLGYVVACAAPIILTFYYIPRLLLPATPVLILIAVTGLAQAANGPAPRRFTFFWTKYKGRAVMIMTLIVVYPALLLSYGLWTVLQAQPAAEVALVDQLVPSVGPTGQNPVSIVSTYQYLGYFADNPDRLRHRWAPHYGAQFPHSLLDLVSVHNAVYVLISDRTTGGAIRGGSLDPVIPRCWILQQEQEDWSGTIRLYRNECGSGQDLSILHDRKGFS